MSSKHIILGTDSMFNISSCRSVSNLFYRQSSSFGFCCCCFMTLHPPERVSKTNNNTDMISYAAMLTKDTTPYDLNTTLQPKSSLKRNFTVSYDINVTNELPNMSNTTKKKQNKKTHELTRDVIGSATNTPTAATISNEDTISTFLDENNKTEQANITNIISETVNLINLHSYKC